MGRRSRARERAAVNEAAGPGTTPVPARRRGWLRALNPFRFRRLTRSRARAGAVGFGLAAILFLLVGRISGDVAWYSSAVLLAILAAAWGIVSALLGEDEPPA